MKDDRWKQRFQNFDKAYQRLIEAANQKNLNELERNGLIQRFEFTIDLSWKVMKDYLEEKALCLNHLQKTRFDKHNKPVLLIMHKH